MAQDWKNIRKLQNGVYKKLDDFLSSYKQPYSHIRHNHRQIIIELKIPDAKKMTVYTDILNNIMIVTAFPTSKKIANEKYERFYRKIPLPTGLSLEKLKLTQKTSSIEIRIPKNNKS